ncbi:MAG: hypothetical protein LBJ12_02300 [Oscillospiraceae bacterium]|nr:hypothetical protein [Oscillospiraceae bacterium]
MFCPNCGTQAEAGSICPNCGVYVPGQTGAPQATPPPMPYQQPYGQQPFGAQPGYGALPPVDDQPNVGLNLLVGFLGCLSPICGIVGLIIYLTGKDNTPNKAKAIGKATLIGVIVGFALNIVLGIALAATGGLAAFFADNSDIFGDDFYNQFQNSLALLTTLK